MSRVLWIAALSSALGWWGCRPAPEAAPEKPGKRIVSLHDVTTEVVVTLGGAKHLIGVGRSVGLPAHIEKQIADVPRLLNAEALLSARPQVLLGLDVVNSDDPAMVAAVREQGADVYLPNPASFQDLYGLVRAVGAKTGAADVAERLASELREQVESLTVRRERPVRVFVYDCCEPVFTAGGGTVFNELIHRAGGVNIFADLKADWTTVSWEEVFARRPEFVVVTTYEQNGKDTTPAKRAALKALPPLADLPVLELPLGWALGGIRSVDGLRSLRAALEDVPAK